MYFLMKKLTVAAGAAAGFFGCFFTTVFLFTLINSSEKKEKISYTIW